MGLTLYRTVQDSTNEPPFKRYVHVHVLEQNMCMNISSKTETTTEHMSPNTLVAACTCTYMNNHVHSAPQSKKEENKEESHAQPQWLSLIFGEQPQRVRRSIM